MGRIERGGTKQDSKSNLEEEEEEETAARRVDSCKRKTPIESENNRGDDDSRFKVDVFQRLYILSKPMQKIGRLRRKKILEACLNARKVWVFPTRNITIADQYGMR